ncbi:MAG: cobalt-precorrin-6A reductase [Dongiaceae bacterium]
MAEGASERRIMILGGTTEAAQLARALERRPDLKVITSLAGRTREPTAVPGGTRSGGFGGIEGLIRFVREEHIDVVIDATHPYAEQISRHAVVASRSTGVPLVRLERPPWPRQPGDRWVLVDSVAEAARTALDYGRRAFLTVGTKELQAFAGMERMWFLVRLIEQPIEPLPLLHYQVVTGRGPFTAEDERKLLQQHRIDMVIAKNSGGDATYGKIAAARALGLPVILVRRPIPPFDLPASAVFATADDVLAWLNKG